MLAVLRMIAVVYLCYGPQGIFPAERFIDSYLKHSAGVPHELAVSFRGFGSALDLVQAVKLFQGFGHLVVDTDKDLWDLGAYRQIVDGLPQHDTFLFLNSHSEILADDYLRKLSEALQYVSMVGCTGSYEQGAASYFPNPHLRTNAFMLERGSVEAFDWPLVDNHMDAHALECGDHGLTAQIESQLCAVVGREGMYWTKEWRKSRTYRAGEQENLLIADNRTRDYQRADPEMRAYLETLAWGTAQVAA